MLLKMYLSAQTDTGNIARPIGSTGLPTAAIPADVFWQDALGCAPAEGRGRPAGVVRRREGLSGSADHRRATTVADCALGQSGRFSAHPFRGATGAASIARRLPNGRPTLDLPPRFPHLSPHLAGV